MAQLQQRDNTNENRIDNQNKNVNDIENKNDDSCKFIYKKLNANDLHVSKNMRWLESRFHFRFADWMPDDDSLYSFGVLHVLNDDLVQPLNGFGMHPHQNQEIFSYIIDGELTHEDSEGNKESLSRGAIQFMSAGTGIWHSEMNNHDKKVCRFLQIWIYPSKKKFACSIWKSFI
jgi:redox-sensitive bicupin YhaK (pirin superfamily)